MAAVSNGDTATVEAGLVVLTTMPATIPTTAWTTAPTTVRTTQARTIAVPTSWPGATATTESPVDPAVIIGAVGIGVGSAVLRKP